MVTQPLTKESSGMAYLRVTASVGDATDSNGSSVVSEAQEIKITMVETEGEEPAPMLAVPGPFDARDGYTKYPIATGTNVYSGYRFHKLAAGEI